MVDRFGGISAGGALNECVGSPIREEKSNQHMILQSKQHAVSVKSSPAFFADPALSSRMVSLI
jgi:hypothetical protein